MTQETINKLKKAAEDCIGPALFGFAMAFPFVIVINPEFGITALVAVIAAVVIFGIVAHFVSNGRGF